MEENEAAFFEANETQWINTYGWKNIKDVTPKSNTEVVIFYISSDNDGTSCFMSEVIHEKFIELLNSPSIYWIDKPE